MNTSRTIKKIGIILALLTVTACARNQPWRTVNSDKLCTSVSPEPLKEEECIIENIKDENGEDLYSLGFLEFTDRGNLFDNQARNKLLEKIEADAKENGALVIVYAHGWNHNSSFEDGNVKQFRETLRKISSMGGVKRERPVYGIYIGWRGRVLPGWLNIALTFWDRKSIAQTIGKGGVSDILLRLELIKKKYQNNDNTLVVTGHSFGAAAILSGLNEILLQRILDSKYQNDNDTGNPDKIEYFADGVVLVNPAIEASQIFQTFENAMELNLDKNNRRSLITIITSEDDNATRFLFPIGQTVDTIFTKQEQLERDYTPHKISEYDLDTTTIGHYKPFHTGNLIDNNTIKNNKYLYNLFLGQQKTNEKEVHNAEKDNEMNLNQLCSEAHPQETDGNFLEYLLKSTPENWSHSSYDISAFSELLKMGTGDTGDIFITSDPLRSGVRLYPGEPRRGTLTDGEIIKKFQVGYVDCCKQPQACILSNKDKNIICNKNIPISFIYTNKALIKNHNDVFNDDFLAYLLAGVTGSLFKERSICKNKEIDKGNEKVNDKIEELIKGCSKDHDFSFSDCYSYFHKALSDPQKKKCEKIRCE